MSNYKMEISGSRNCRKIGKLKKTLGKVWKIGKSRN